MKIEFKHIYIYLTLVTAFSSGCSIKQIAVNSIADSLAENNTVYASDNDLQLIADATPFALKTIESLLASAPEHKGLLLSATRGFTQYAYAYVQLPADEIEHNNYEAAYRERQRALKLYIRARVYGVRGLETDNPGLINQMRKDPEAALASTTRDDVGLLYWTAAAWGSIISLGKDNPNHLADIPIMHALINRAMELDETFDNGALHVFFISYEMSRRNISEGAEERAKKHFQRAVELSNGTQASPYVAMAESYYIPMQDRQKFKLLLETALVIDVDEHKDTRLANLIMQRRASFLLSKIDEYFVE